MEKIATTQLTKGKVRTYNAGKIKLHIYENDDFTEKITTILEKNNQAIIIDAPVFTDNIRELEKYIASNELQVA
jgi:hypothetical protein